jgi:hypothetical protein
MRPTFVCLALVIATGAEAAPCDEVPIYERGREVDRVCAEDARTLGLTVVDLGDDFTPLPLRGHPYAATYVALANERAEADHRGDRYFELYGIPPTPRLVAARLLDDARHVCHAMAPRAAVSAATRRLWLPAAPATLVAELGARMACERLIGTKHRPRTWQIESALAAYQREHAVVARGVYESETRRALLTPTRELDWLAVLRVLRTRVVDATGLLEDGSALSTRGLVVGRILDGEPVTRGVGRPPIPEGAPDLVARATDAAAHALGWTDPARTAAWFRRNDVPARVAVRLPALPAYYSPHMDLRAEIDRGDVSYAVRRGKPARPPVLTLWVRTKDGEEIALVRWPTTIGGWKKELTKWGGVGLRYKDSDVGPRVWRDVVVTPAWLAPPSTPPRTLVKSAGVANRWIADTSLVAPGYASAYGLVMLVHHEVLMKKGRATYVDRGIRTHGTVSYDSIGASDSHGCHRLFNGAALSLTAFLLKHRLSLPHGIVDKPFLRTVAWKGRIYRLPIPHRGARYELLPPVPVEVLPGTVRGNAKRPPTHLVSIPAGGAR